MSRREAKFPDNGFEAWGGYMNAKISKLEEQYATSAAKSETKVSDIFNGISIYVNGYTVPSADELKVLMSQHGGVYHTYQRSDDYIIATNLPDTKVKKISLGNVVKPEWITDSIAANRLLDFRDYLLFSNSRLQPKLNFTRLVKDSTAFPKTDLDNLTNLNENVYGEPFGHSLNEAEVIHTEINTKAVLESDIQVCNKSNTYCVDDGENMKDNFFLKKIEPSVTKTAADPNFITEFYNNSRLHHISQLGACFKQYVNDLSQGSNFIFPARTQLKERVMTLCNSNNLSPIEFERGKIIMHIDMDCFFVSVGLRKRPDLRGKPIAVTHSKGGQPRPKRPGVDRNTEFNLYKQKKVKQLEKATGMPEEEIEIESRVDNIGDEGDKYGSMSEIASCSYEARAKGICNGMFMGAALRLCPDLQTIPYDFEGYKEVAYTLYNTVAQYTLDIEAVSCDEMYADCTELIRSLNVSVQDFSTVLRNEIKDKTGCPCSCGFGGNRLQARLATKRAKPDGQFFLTADLVEDFMFDIKLRDLPGVGHQTSQKLEALGHQTCGSLQSLTLATLKTHLGNKTGIQLFDHCRGRDTHCLTFHTVRKSVSAEVNYGIRFENNAQCLEFLKQLSAEVHNRLQQFKVVGKCITLKLLVRAKDAPVETAKFMGHGFCDVINKSILLNNATDDVEVITREIISLCTKQNIDPKELRGIGIQVTKLESVTAKKTKGTMNKFLVSNTKSDRKLDTGQTLVKTEHSNFTKAEITPKKEYKSTTSDKRSPILMSKKSPGKRRGRLPKTLKLQTSSKNLMSKFLNGHILKDTPYKDPMIKEECVQPQQKFLVQVKEEKFQPHGLIGLPWERVRNLLRAWLESGQTPLPCDVNMICDYMRDMVINRNIDTLNILINFLRRRTKELKSKDWIEACNSVIEQVQNAMIAVYGKKMWIED